MTYLFQLWTPLERIAWIMRLKILISLLSRWDSSQRVLHESRTLVQALRKDELVKNIPMIIQICFLRGSVVEWLERLGNGAENRRKVVSSGIGFAMRHLENCQPDSKWVPFSRIRDKTAKGKGWASRFISCRGKQLYKKKRIVDFLRGNMAV